jgi:hypothetical protein
MKSSAFRAKTVKTSFSHPYCFAESETRYYNIIRRYLVKPILRVVLQIVPRAGGHLKEICRGWAMPAIYFGVQVLAANRAIFACGAV